MRCGVGQAIRKCAYLEQCSLQVQNQNFMMTKEGLLNDVVLHVVPGCSVVM